MLEVRYVARSMERRENGLLGMSPNDSLGKISPRTSLVGIMATFHIWVDGARVV